jgi:PAS domain S-box-containing protein
MENNKEIKDLKMVIGEKTFKFLEKKLNNTDLETIIKLRHAIKLGKAMGYCFWLGNKKHETIYTNEFYQKTTEYSLEECLKKPANFCFDDQSKKRITEHHKLRPRGISSQYEATYLTKSNKKVPMLIIGAPHEDSGTYGIHINLSEIKKLTEKEKISEQIIQNSPEAIVILDKNQKIKFWNNGATKAFGYKEHEALKKSISIIVPKNLKKESRDIIKEVDGKNYIKSIETQRITKNKTIIDVSLTIIRVSNYEKKFLGYLVLYKDISEQKKAHTQLQKRFETIQDAYKELGLQKRQMDYLYEISNMAASSEKLPALTNLIVSAIALLTKCDGAILRIYKEKTKTLELTACIGVNQKWLSKNKVLLRNSLAEEAIKHKRPLIFDNIQTSSKHQSINLVKSHEFNTLIVIPLLFPSKIIGTISLYAINPAKFRFIETDFLENFSKQCAIALYVKMMEK